MVRFGDCFWVLAYDTEYAMVDRDDDLRIGIQTSAITLGRFDVAAVMAFYSLHLVMWTALAWPLAGSVWMATGITAAATQAVWHGWLIRERQRDACFKAFRLNHWVGFAVFAGVVGSYALS